MTSNFYTFYQRSGVDGFEVDKERHTSRYVIIEAMSADEANARAATLGMDHQSRWQRVGEAMRDEEPMVFSEPVVSLTHPPDRFDITTELDQPLVSVHYADGLVETFTPRVRLESAVVREARKHELAEHEEFHGWRRRVKCGACGAEFTVPRGTDLGSLAISGCRGPGGAHPGSTCECAECEPL